MAAVRSAQKHGHRFKWPLGGEFAFWQRRSTPDRTTRQRLVGKLDDPIATPAHEDFKLKRHPKTHRRSCLPGRRGQAPAVMRQARLLRDGAGQRDPGLTLRQGQDQGGSDQIHTALTALRLEPGLVLMRLDAFVRTFRQVSVGARSGCRLHPVQNLGQSPHFRFGRSAFGALAHHRRRLQQLVDARRKVFLFNRRCRRSI